ncbi:hypothetical protein M3J07_003845 [Ascochyta lentis]
MEHRTPDFIRYVSLEDGLGYQQFEAFVLGFAESHTLTQFEGESIGCWRANIDVQAESSLEDTSPPVPSEPSFFRPASTTKPIVTLQFPTKTSVNRSISPRLRVRAHLLDVIIPFPSCSCRYPRTRCAPQNSDSSRGMLEHCSTYSELIDLKPPWSIGKEVFANPPYVHILYERPRLCKRCPRDIADPIDSAWQEHCESTALDLREFQMVLEEAKQLGGRASSVRYHRPGEVFLTRNSIGFARSGFAPKDVIFAIDDIRTPLILRRTGQQQYQVAGECYFWAALELENQRPEPGVGIWDAEPYNHGCPRTQTIEIL